MTESSTLELLELLDNATSLKDLKYTALSSYMSATIEVLRVVSMEVIQMAN